jgi:hypothetical protein
LVFRGGMVFADPVRDPPSDPFSLDLRRQKRVILLLYRRYTQNRRSTYDY